MIPIQPVRFSTKKRAKVWRKTGGCCFYCGEQLIGQNVGIHYTDGSIGLPSRMSWVQSDHQHPRAQRGSDRLENLVPACGSCNARKCGRTVHEYRRWLMKKNGGEPVLFHGEVCS